MHRLALFALAVAAGAALTGCGNTLSGARQDAAQNTQAAKQAAQNAGQAVKQVPENAAANTVVRPAVKTALIRDPVLNDPRNLIDVNAAPGRITLTGHVQTASMKQRAEEDAQAALSKHPGYTLDNQLAVAGAGGAAPAAP
jgi:osmotically-inducible protein OsmY